MLTKEIYGTNRCPVVWWARNGGGIGSAHDKWGQWFLNGLRPQQTLRAQLDVTAASGSSLTLDVLIQDTLDGTNWDNVGTFTQKTATGREVLNVTTPFSDELRVVWTIAGTTPSREVEG